MPKPPLRREVGRASPPSSTPEVVDPRWLIKAFLIVVLIALVCGYLTLCGLYYRGQWQLVLHPARTSAPSTLAGGVPFEVIRFGAQTTGVPQLAGWWIPARPGAVYAHLTFLYLRGGDGSLADDQAMLGSLHDLGAAIFAVDYRGYGQSADLHPSEQSMEEDANTAWTYLTGSRGLQSANIIPYGRRLGASLVLGLASSAGPVSAIILDEPDFNVVDRVEKDPRSRIVPVRLLFHNRFALLPALDQIKFPKLILTRGTAEDPAALRAADPKMTVVLPSSSPGQYVATVKRFLDLYAPPTPAPWLVPTRTP